ncbi:MAG: heavy-metal-associated domain-containing protein [Aureibaculum sp.]|jgi:hypothetical protein
MSLLTENIIPGSHGKIFGTNAVHKEDLLEIKNALLKMHGIKDVIINLNVFPKEFTIYTTTLVKVENIQNVVEHLGFHAIPQGLFKL